MTKIELFDRIEKIRSSFLQLCENVGIGAGYRNNGFTSSKYPMIPNEHYNDEYETEQEKINLKYGEHYANPKVKKGFEMFPIYSILHAELLVTLEEFGIENYKNLSMVYRTAIRNLYNCILYNCSYDYQNEVKNIDSEISL